MTLNHSKTWPVSTLAVVQLRVDPNGRTYSTQFDADLVTDFDISQQDDQDHGDHENEDYVDDVITHQRLPNGTSTSASNGHCSGVVGGGKTGKNGTILTLPLSQRHVKLFTVHETHDEAMPMPVRANQHQRHPYKTTVRTDTVSTILEHESDNHNNHNINLDLISSITTVQDDNDDDNKEDNDKDNYEKFHVLALAKIDELNEIDRVKTPSVRVENWDLIYNDPGNITANGSNSGRKLCPACTAAAAAAAGSSPMDGYKGKNSPGDYNDRLLVDLPLDARKATTLRRHYYPEGGWGWVIITCTVLVHVLNIGLQLACSQLAPSGAEKFKTTQVHIAG